MSTSIQEFTTASASHLRVDREAGVLRSVKLLGLSSSNGRRYLESALREAALLYEGAKVNVNHAKAGPLAPREYQDRLGVIRGVKFREGEGLFGDLHYNPKHALAEQLVWDAEHAPQNVGVSHNVVAHTTRQGGATIIERIEHVQSVDLVADPATTRGLFECQVPSAECGMKAANGPELQSAAESDGSSELRGSQFEFLARGRRICELLAEHNLPLPGAEEASERCITSDSFVDALWQAEDDAALVRQVQDRAALVEAARTWGHAEHDATPPTSRDQFTAVLTSLHASIPHDAKAFAESISR
jgi:hypothetical protein